MTCRFKSCHSDQYPTVGIHTCSSKSLADREEEASYTMLNMATNLDINLVALLRECSVIGTRLLWEQASQCKSDVFDQRHYTDGRCIVGLQT